jgi:hypothetical protein
MVEEANCYLLKVTVIFKGESNLNKTLRLIPVKS